MSDEQSRKLIQGALNRSLSGLREDPLLTQRVMRQTPRSRKPGRRRRCAIASAAIILCAVITAWAAGLVFSPHYDAKRLANRALEEQYGITDEMMTVLVCSETENTPDGGRVFLYEPVEMLYAPQVGVYTVTVTNGRADAAWSHDGEEPSGEPGSTVWGSAQLAMLCSDQYGELLATLPHTEVPGQENEPLSEEELEAYDQAWQQAWEESKAQATAAAAITLEDARTLALAALAGEYGLTAQQCAQFTWTEDPYDIAYRFTDGEPVVELLLHLTQQEGVRTEKDGIYGVTVNLKSGVIEDILYDSGLAANE